MKERPILFSGEMVRAILDGRKTVTRRVVKPQPKEHLYFGSPGLTWKNYTWDPRDRTAFNTPYGQPGDRLYVRESWRATGDHEIQYAEDGSRAFFPKSNKLRHTTGYRPSIHMPRWASRITLEVTGVRVERVQEITEMDAMSEGLWDGQTNTNPPESKWHVEKFRELWDSLNAKRGFGWEKNPFVWVVEFKKLSS